MGEPSTPNLLGQEERDVVYVPTDLTYKAVKHPQRMGRGDMVQPFTSESVARGRRARTARDPQLHPRGSTSARRSHGCRASGLSPLLSRSPNRALRGTASP